MIVFATAVHLHRFSTAARMRALLAAAGIAWSPEWGSRRAVRQIGYGRLVAQMGTEVEREFANRALNKNEKNKSK